MQSYNFFLIFSLFFGIKMTRILNFVGRRINVNRKPDGTLYPTFRKTECVTLQLLQLKKKRV